MSDMTPLQVEIRDASIAGTRDMGLSLEGLTNSFLRQQCRDAHYRRMRQVNDVIGQRYGLAPMLWKAIDAGDQASVE